VVNGKTYDLYNINELAGKKGDFSFYVLSNHLKSAGETANGVDIIYTMENLDTINRSTVPSLTRIDFMFNGAPTSVADLPKSKAEYVGTYDMSTFDFIKSSGKFTATADFGALKTIDGILYKPDNISTNYTLEGKISENGFDGDFDGLPNINVTSSAAGIFVGPSASSILGAGHINDKIKNKQYWVTFSGDKQ
jgi:C-lobe and N-lobe beta barrels of Tf-binding protein B